MSKMYNFVKVHKELEDLRESVLQLKKEISIILSERDDIVLRTWRDVELKYYMNFGKLEYEVYENDFRARQLKRKAELIKKKLDNHESFNIVEIDEIVEKEFKDQKIHLEEKWKFLQAVIRDRKKIELSRYEIIELKNIYLKIVKFLNPDINPSLNEDRKMLFLEAVKAYQNNDIVCLRKIESQLPDKEETIIGIKKLRNEKERLEEVMLNVKDDVASIKKDFPYRALKVLETEENIKQYRNHLELNLEYLEKLSDSYEDEIVKMMKG